MMELSEIDDHLIVDVRNNGLPFPKNFDREKFITKYSTQRPRNTNGITCVTYHKKPPSAARFHWLHQLHKIRPGPKPRDRVVHLASSPSPVLVRSTSNTQRSHRSCTNPGIRTGMRSFFEGSLRDTASRSGACGSRIQ